MKVFFTVSITLIVCFLSSTILIGHSEAVDKSPHCRGRFTLDFTHNPKSCRIKNIEYKICD